MRIRIIATPPGQAPKHLQRHWVGREFDALETPGGFRVLWNVALRELRKRSEDAELWHRMRYPACHPDYMVFGREFCEVVEEDPNEMGVIPGTDGGIAHYPL